MRKLFFIFLSILLFSCVKDSNHFYDKFDKVDVNKVNIDTVSKSFDSTSNNLRETVKDKGIDCIDWYLITYGTDGRIYAEMYLYTSCPNTSGGGGGSSDGTVRRPEEIEVIPCPSSFKFVVNGTGNFQNAVITDYWFGLIDAKTGRTFPLHIGMIEVGMPYKTYHKDYVRNAAGLASRAALLAEQRLTQEMANALRANPALPTNAFDNAIYEAKFRNLYKQQLDALLRAEYYPGESVYPSTVYTDNASFGLQDASKYQTLKYYGRDCF